MFREDISYLLVMATPVTVQAIGIEFCGADGKAVRQSAGGMRGLEMHFDADSLLSVPTSRIGMHGFFLSI